MLPSLARNGLVRHELFNFIRCLSSSSPPVISIDRSGLYQPQQHDHSAEALPNKEPETPLTRHLKSIIRFRGGPITIAEYMSEVLTNATAGYYTRRDVFGTAGDFTTSPEISQMFGEMIGIWAVAMWQQMGSPSKLRLVELGPGRGTLMADLLRGTSTFSSFASALSICFVEVSPVLRELQFKNLNCVAQSNKSNAEQELSKEEGIVEAHTATTNIPVSWHRTLDDIPIANKNNIPTLYIAHEFLDALPVHQFQKSKQGLWCERLVDEDSHSTDNPHHFRLVLSPGTTPASRALLPRRLQGLSVTARAALQGIEVCPQAMALVEALAGRVQSQGGAALLIDYGQNRPYQGSLQGIKDHEPASIFASPGDVDLSAWVDFDALRLSVERSGCGARVFGPISQGTLLHRLGIQARLQQLLEAVDGGQEDSPGAAGNPTAEDLIHGYLRLVSNAGDNEYGVDGMGESYQAMCIVPGKLPTPPIGFEQESSS